MAEESEIYEDLKDYFDEISDHYADLASDGKFSFGDVLLLVGKASASFIQLVERFTELESGASKKEAVLAGLDAFYDEVIAPMDLKAVPNLIEPILDTAIKQLILTVSSAGIDTIVTIFNKTGWNPLDLFGPQAFSAPYFADPKDLKKEIIFF